MAHPDLHRALLNGGQKMYRRRKKHQGADWTPDNASALAGDGPWCKFCRQRHGYKSNIVGVSFEKRNGVWIILFYCKKSGGNVIEEMPVQNWKSQGPK